LTSNVMIIGSNGGIGSACLKQCTNDGLTVQALTSSDLDLNFPQRIFDLDLGHVDLLINCAGHSQGTYLGFLNNHWRDQLSQINVNYVSNLFLLKHFANSRTSGKFVWISTSLMDHGKRPFHSIYLSTKQASKTAIDLVRLEASHIGILEVNVGPTKTGFRHRNFLHTKSQEEVNRSYDQDHSHSPEYVAKQIMSAVSLDLKEIKL